MHQANKKTKKDAKQPKACFAWHHIRGTVPKDWEITAYSIEDRAGRLEFNSRRGREAVVIWDPCNYEPDRAATMATFLANDIIGEGNAPNLQPADILTNEIGPFLVGWLDETLPSQAMAYKPKSGHLIRWVFEGHASKVNRENVIRPILESCDFNEDEAACEYNVSGIHCFMPWEYKVEDSVLLPADVTISFVNETAKRSAVFHRWGLAEIILGTHDLADFYAPILSTRGIAADTCTPCYVDNWDARRLTFKAPEKMRTARTKHHHAHNGIAIIWYDKAENRIYAFEQIGPDETAVLDFNAVIPGRTLKERVQ